MSDIIERLRGRASLDEYRNSHYDKLHYPLLREAADEIERLRKAIQDYLDGNYDCPRSHRHDDGPNKGCAHGRFYWEDCGNCIDDYFAGVLNPLGGE